MKKLFISLFFVLISSISFAQVTLTQEQYDKLPKEAKDAIKKEQIITTISSYTGLGHEIGTAVNETLKAVEDSAVRISETDIGKVATFIIVWKLLYKEIVCLVISFIFFIGWSVVITFLFNRAKNVDQSNDWGPWGASAITTLIAFAGYGIITIIAIA